MGMDNLMGQLFRYSGVLVVGMVVVLVGCASAPKVSDTAKNTSGSSLSHLSSESEVTSQTLNGQDIFEQNCMGCHVPQHIHRGPIQRFMVKQQATESDFMALIRQGTANSGYMRRFSQSELSDASVKVLYDWIQQETGK